MFTDVLLDVPSDAESENNITGSGNEIDFTKNRRARLLPSDSDISEEDLSISYETNSWTKQDKIPVLENFIGNPGIKQFPVIIPAH